MNSSDIEGSSMKIFTARICLGIAYPLLFISVGFWAFFGNYSELPSRITVHFDITRTPTTSLSTPTFGALMLTILIITALACIFVAVKKGKFTPGTYYKIASHSGFFSAVVSSLIVGAVLIHRGLSHWQDAIGPGWWLLLVVCIGFTGATVAKFLAIKIHGPSSISQHEPRI